MNEMEEVKEYTVSGSVIYDFETKVMASNKEEAIDNAEILLKETLNAGNLFVSLRDADFYSVRTCSIKENRWI